MSDNNLVYLDKMVPKLVQKSFQEKEVDTYLKKGLITRESIEQEIFSKNSQILIPFKESNTELEKLEMQKNELEDNFNLKKNAMFSLINILFKFKLRVILFGLLTFVISIIVIIHFNLFNQIVTSSFWKYIQENIFLIIAILSGMIGVIIPPLIQTFSTYVKIKNEFNDVSLKLTYLREKIEQEIYEYGILPEVKSFINSKLTPSYKIELNLLSKNIKMKGYFDPKYEIPTKSKEDISRFLERMSNGSIGIAGPRGAGKSTLISSFCVESLEELKNKEVLSVMTSAPVDYDPREYILHIFSLVCKQALNLNKTTDVISLDFSDNPQKHFIFNENVSKLFISLVSIFIAFYFLLMAQSLIYNVDVLPVPILGFFYITISFIFISLSFLMLYSYIKNTKYKNKNEDEIIKEARRNLQLIKFQSSFSSAWSGEFKIPIGVKGGLNSGTTLSQNRLSLPEIVTSYRDYIGLLSRKYKIIIGVDELDKISSSDKAYSFLNEIKGIFNLKDCYYLISVSEEAMSNFNKKGMSFRDAFDSSFDDIIYISYLNLKSSQELITRRVIGIPFPFICLCYLISGGLARDLIRTCRDLIDFYELNPGINKLSFISKELIKKDILSKISAIRIDGREANRDDNNYTKELIEELYQLEKSLKNESLIWMYCLNLMSFSEKPLMSCTHKSYQYEKEYKSTFLRMQIGTYLYYALSIMEFFEKIDESSFKRYEESGIFDELTEALHLLGFYPTLSEKIITKFREKCGMKVFKRVQNQFIDIDVT